MQIISDLVDQWSSPDNQADQLRLIGTLFEFRKRTGANVLVLGGDVHAATTATLYSDDERYRVGSETRAVLHEVVSSGISHSAAMNNLYRVLEQGDQLAEHVAVKFGQVFYERSFAEIELLAEDRRIRCRLHLEERNTSVPFDWPG
jgi:phosphodiesterase/alkaline phosphatase D-like protein